MGNYIEPRDRLTIEDLCALVLIVAVIAIVLFSDGDFLSPVRWLFIR